MTAPTHYAFSYLVCSIAGISPTTALATSLVGLLPDIDHPESMVGRLFPFISKRIMQKYGHRTVTHSIFAILMIALTLIPLLFLDAGRGGSSIRPEGGSSSSSGSVLYLAMVLSFSSHIFIDLFNRAGVKLLAPFSTKEYISFHTPILRIMVRSWQEYLLLFVIVFLSFTVTGETFSINKAIRSASKLIYLHYDGALTDYENASKNICTAKIEYFDPVESKIKKEDFIVLTMFPENIYLLRYDPANQQTLINKRSNDKKPSPVYGELSLTTRAERSRSREGAQRAERSVRSLNIQVSPENRLIIKKDIINEIEVTDTNIPRNQTHTTGTTLRELSLLPADSIISGTIIMKNFQPALRNSDYICVSHSPTATTITLICALSGELGEILALERMRSAELETLKAKQSSYQIIRLQDEQKKLESQIKTLSLKGFYSNYPQIIRLNSEVKKIDSRIEALRLREASGADADIAAKIEMMENAYSVEYEVWVTEL
jgi:membrane-bound metal-dependent hydrolase YbcI (DUF457 family)